MTNFLFKFCDYLLNNIEGLKEIKDTRLHADKEFSKTGLDLEDG